MKNFTNVKELGNLIKTQRKSIGLTQEQLASWSDVGRRFVVDLESGKETIHLGKVLNILKTIGFKISITKKGGIENE